eukprot:133517-Prorocentrum_minimum.AAC.1
MAARMSTPGLTLRLTHSVYHSVYHSYDNNKLPSRARRPPSHSSGREDASSTRPSAPGCGRAPPASNWSAVRIYPRFLHLIGLL